MPPTSPRRGSHLPTRLRLSGRLLAGSARRPSCRRMRPTRAEMSDRHAPRHRLTRTTSADSVAATVARAATSAALRPTRFTRTATPRPARGRRHGHVTTVVVGAGQCGLAMSRALGRRSVEHVVLERGRIANSWRTRALGQPAPADAQLDERPAGHPYGGTGPGRLHVRASTSRRRLQRAAAARRRAGRGKRRASSSLDALAERLPGRRPTAAPSPAPAS